MIGYLVNLFLVIIGPILITRYYIKEEHKELYPSYIITLIVSAPLTLHLTRSGYTMETIALLLILLWASFTDSTTGYVLDGVVLCGACIPVLRGDLGVLEIALVILLVLLTLSKLGNLRFLGTGDVELFLLIWAVKGFWILMGVILLASLVAVIGEGIRATLTRQKPKVFPFVPYIAFAYFILMFTGGYSYVINCIIG